MSNESFAWMQCLQAESVGKYQQQLCQARLCARRTGKSNTPSPSFACMSRAQPAQLTNDVELVEGNLTVCQSGSSGLGHA